MTLFEYLAIAFSLILSFAALRLIGGLPYAADPNRRYWVHLVFVCNHLAVVALVFWNLWSFRNATWTLPKFLIVLIIPGLIYFLACALIAAQFSPGNARIDTRVNLPLHLAKSVVLAQFFRCQEVVANF